ncbi:MAG: outer membrane beta-barrel protein [Flavobacteriales bacterium]|nr:outer membrane beta-barrel protein [Flavobacteriales bacterium]
MMKLALTIALIALTTVGLNAQTNNTDSLKTDSVEVVITPKKGQDSTIVKVAGMKIIVLSNDKNEPKKIVVDTEVKDDTTYYKDNQGDNVSHWAGVRIGVNGFLSNEGLPLPASHRFLELDYGKSVCVDVNLLEKDFRLYKQHIELVTGLGMHFANYTFKNKYTTLLNTDPLSASVDSTILLDKNKLRATYLTAPLMLGFSTHKDESKAFRFAAGGQVSWRIASKLKQQYNFGGQTFKPRIKSDYDLNPLLFHAIASMGYGPINLVATYGLNTLFESNKTVALNPFDVGVQIMF